MLPSKKGRKEKKILLSPAARPKQTKKKKNFLFGIFRVPRLYIVNAEEDTQLEAED